MQPFRMRNFYSGKFKRKQKKPKHISVAGKCKITLNLQVTLDIPYLIGRMAGISQ